MRFRWRRVVLFLVCFYVFLQFGAIYLFNPPQERSERDSEQESPPSVQAIKEDVVVRDHDRIQHFPPPEAPVDDEDYPNCELTHKDTLSAISRATTRLCKREIRRVYCKNKVGDLLANKIERTCPHKKTFIAPGPDIKPEDNIQNYKDIKIAYLLIVHGRAVRQIKRLLKLIYHENHFFYFHVDSRSEYLYHELIQLASHFPNVEVATWREAPIWGGTSLLTTIFNGLRDLIESGLA